MNTRHDNTDGPEDIDAAFAEIVADLEKDSTFSRFPGDEGGDGESPPTARIEQVAPAVQEGPRDWAPAADEEDEHFVPPEPPPMPRPAPATLLGILIVVAGIVVLLVPGLIGLPSTVRLPIGLLLISGGICWLLTRLRQGPPSNPGDDGAQV